MRTTHYAGHVAVHPESPYAPIRYEATRPFARQLGQRFMVACRTGEAHRVRHVTEELFPRLNQIVGAPGPTQAENVNVQVFGHFLDGGRIIFDLTAALTDALAFTDVDAIPCGEIPVIESARGV